MKKAKKQAAQKAATEAANILDTAEASDSSSEEEDELDSPRDVARAAKFADPETFKIKKVAYKESDDLEAVEKSKAAKTKVGREEVGEVYFFYGTISNHPHKRGRVTEAFLPDSGASLTHCSDE